MTPNVSIIMPVYNAEKYLHRAVESILNQTMQEWELIMIDDGSRDSSLASVMSMQPVMPASASFIRLMRVCLLHDRTVLMQYKANIPSMPILTTG